MKIEDIEASSYEISLTKLTGLKIKDVYGYLSNEFGEPTFKLTKLIFDNDQEMWFEGEHDFPYLTTGATDVPNFDDETLEDLYKQAHPDDDEDDDNPY